MARGRLIDNLAIVRAVDEAVDGEPQLGGGIGAGDEHVSLDLAQFEHVAEFVEVDATASVGVSFIHHLAKSHKNTYQLSRFSSIS
jgi:hypothetical protein